VGTGPLQYLHEEWNWIYAQHRKREKKGTKLRPFQNFSTAYMSDCYQILLFYFVYSLRNFKNEVRGSDSRVKLHSADFVGF
jgi:hypothetical protein